MTFIDNELAVGCNAQRQSLRAGHNVSNTSVAVSCPKYLSCRLGPSVTFARVRLLIGVAISHLRFNERVALRLTAHNRGVRGETVRGFRVCGWASTCRR
jgi:hypothetical protein